MNMLLYLAQTFGASRFFGEKGCYKLDVVTSSVVVRCVGQLSTFVSNVLIRCTTPMTVREVFQNFHC